VVDGLFQVDLDFGEQAYASGLWLAIEVENEHLVPRQAITGAPFAISSTPGSGSNWNISGADIHYSGGNVGIGISSPSVSLVVVGSVTFGGASNQATGDSSFVGGGSQNSAAIRSFVGGGRQNVADGQESFIGGGTGNSTSGFTNFVGGGNNNSASGSRSFIGGGSLNSTEGVDSFIAGGVYNVTSGANSFAAGNRAEAQHDGTFVWADNGTATNSFSSTGENQFLIRSSGGVGIGTTTPASQLHVRASSDFSPMRVQIEGTTRFNINRDGGTAIGAIAPLSIPTNGLYVAGATGIGVASPQRDFHIKQRSSTTSEIGLQIERGGSSTNNWAFYVAVSDNLGFRYNDSLVARIDTSGEFATLSDARFKTDIEPLFGALERVMQLEPSSYRMTVGAVDDETSVGLIAQQVGQVLPGAVSEEEGTLGVYYNQITALNTAALIELNTRYVETTRQQRKAFDEQQATIELQRARIARSKSRLERVEAENAELRQIADRNIELEARLAALESVLLEDRQVAERSK
jgi:hypothetical protein